MISRIYTLLASKDLGAAGVEVINVDVPDAITQIVMRWRCTNVTVSAMLAPVAACISKIELIDGSEVLYSLSGRQAQALNYWNQGEMPHTALSLVVGGYFEFVCALDFGRWFGDESFWVNPLAHKNLQLKITWDEDACNTSVVVNSCAVYAMCMSEVKGNPIGFLCTKNHYTYACNGANHEYIEIDTDRVIKKILIRAESTDHTPGVLIDTIKLNVDGGKSIPYELKTEDWLEILTLNKKPITQNITLDAAVTANTLYTDLSYRQNIKISYDATPFVTAQSKFAVATWTGYALALAASVDIKKLDATLTGYIPHGLFPVSQCDDWDNATWLDWRNKGKAKLDILSTSDSDSGDTIDVVIESVRPY